MPLTLHIKDEAAMEALGRAIGPQLGAGDFVALEGDLGAGKTVLARAIIRAACNDLKLDVPSPTFTLVQVYENANGPLHHFDLYRLENPDDIFDIGWDEAREGVTLAEWPDRAGPYLPRKTITIRIAHDGTGRRITIEGRAFDL